MAIHVARLIKCAVSLFLLTWLLSIGAHPQSDRRDDIMQSNQPERNLFMKGALQDCLTCETMTIIVSDVAFNPPAAAEFARIAAKLGKSHVRIFLTREDAWASFSVFRRLGCPRLDEHRGELIIYLDRAEKYCGVLPSDQLRHLPHIVSIILSQLGDAKTAGADQRVYLAQRSVSEYQKKESVGAPVTRLSGGLIAYMGKLLKR